STTLKGRLAGSLGAATGCGHIRLSRLAQGTRAEYGYEIAVSGKAAAVGARMLDGAARSLVALFFRQLASASGGVPQRSWWHALFSRRPSRIGGLRCSRVLAHQRPEPRGGTGCLSAPFPPPALSLTCCTRHA